MTPDMKRLCERADLIIRSRFGGPPLTGIGLCYPREAEAIVRAVLLALREPTEEAYWAAHEPFNWGPGFADGSDPDPRKVVTAMIDYILADPVKA